MRTGLVEEQRFASLRASLGPLFFIIWTRPTAITSLARQLGVTKQACSQLANLAERAGYLERIQSSEDGRSKWLHLSRRGRTLVERSIEIIRQADTDYASIVGTRRYARFTKSIAALYKALDFPAESGLAFLEESTRTVGTLPLITQRAQQELMRATSARGHEGLKYSHSQVLPFVGPNGVRISELGRIHGANRQAISATARDLVALGYLRKEPDPLDRRGAILFLSNRGDRLVSDSIAELEALNQRIERILGRAVVSEFLATAATIASALDTEEDVYDIAVSSAPTGSSGATRSRGGRDAMQGLAEQLRHDLDDRQFVQLVELLNRKAATIPLRRSRPKPGSTP